MPGESFLKRAPALGAGVTVAPRITSECPARYLVTEWITMSAPIDKGCCTSGVANVLSHNATAPTPWAASKRRGRFATSSIGLVGDSAHRTSAPSNAAITAGVSLMSTRRSTARPAFSNDSRSALVPAYACVGATMIASGGATDRAAAIAAMPEEKTRADPPSRAPSACSNAVHVGLPARA